MFGKRQFVKKMIISLVEGGGVTLRQMFTTNFWNLYNPFYKLLVKKSRTNSKINSANRC